MKHIPAKIAPDRSPIKKWAKLRLFAGYIYLGLSFWLAKPQVSPAILGLLLIVFGVGIRLIAAATLVKDSELCTKGIYAETRNPLYFGSGLIALGFAVLSLNYIVALYLFFILIPLYHHAMTLEENYLRELFPEQYAKYEISVPRFFPGFKSNDSIVHNLRIARLKDNREIASAFLILIIAALLVIFHSPWKI